MLVTGGAGFLGSHLCERLLADGCEVVCFDNLLTGRMDNVEPLLGHPRFSFEHYDVTNFLYVAGDLDAVLHFASPASPADFERLPIEILKVGSLGTHRALGLAKAKGARFLIASTSECYGDPEVNPQPETYWGRVNPIGIRGVYDEAKRFAEAMTMAYHRHHGVDVRIVRIFNTFGPRMQLHDGRAIPNFMTQAIRGEPITVFGDGGQTRSFCYVDDLIEGILRLLRSDYVGPVNVGNPQEMSLLEMARHIIRIADIEERAGVRRAAARRPEGAASRHHAGAAGAGRLGAARPDRGRAASHPRVLQGGSRAGVARRDVSELARIRNFCIIAHVDHGKSTLADRLLDVTKALSSREKRAQFLDKMDLERERGITIKAQTARIYHRARDGKDYVLNLIDTPGHVDFSYEVSRALEACEGAVLVVDAAQGIEAQTLANTYLALDANLEIVPILNKIDLPSAEPAERAREIEDILGMPADDVLLVSAKTGQGIDELIERIVERVPPPSGDPNAPLRALIFDAWFDPYVGVVLLVRVVDGRIAKGERVKLMAKGSEHDVDDLDVIDPHPRSVEALDTGEVGVVIAGIKTLDDVRIGDTITHALRPAADALPGFREVKPMVFAGLYPVDADEYSALKAALEKLRLNDASFRYEPETSAALGFGFRCGFLGFLHAEIIQERLEREYSLNLISTTPTVRYQVVMVSGESIEIDSPADLPDQTRVERIEEPLILATIHVPSEYLGAVLALCQDRRGTQRDMTQHGTRVQVRYLLPLAEVVADFHDRIKSATRGLRLLRLRARGLPARRPREARRAGELGARSTRSR